MRLLDRNVRRLMETEMAQDEAKLAGPDLTQGVPLDRF